MKKDPKPKKSPFNPDDFIYPASDDKGHGERLWCRLPPALIEQISVFAQSGVFPYRTSSQLVRHGIIEHLRNLQKMAEEEGFKVEGDRLGRTWAAMEIMREEEAALEFEKTMDKLGKLVRRLEAEGHGRRAGELVRRVAGELGGIADDHWRKRYLGAIEAAWGKYVNKGSRIRRMK